MSRSPRRTVAATTGTLRLVGLAFFSSLLLSQGSRSMRGLACVSNHGVTTGSIRGQLKYTAAASTQMIVNQIQPRPPRGGAGGAGDFEPGGSEWGAVVPGFAVAVWLFSAGCSVVFSSVCCGRGEAA